MDSLNSLAIEAVPFKTERIKPSEFLSRSWPVQPGNYTVFRPINSTAVALLQGVFLDTLSGLDLASVAIAGTITTENLGVEHLVKNVIANPHIRHLILLGNDIQGHLPGDALIKLSENGIDSKGRIISAQGARPILKNLTRIEVDHFRSQIRLINLVGMTDLSLLATHLADLNRLSVKPCEFGLRIDLVEIKKAEPARKLRLDQAGYFVIMVMHGRELPILVEHYSNDGVLRHVVEGNDAASICATIVEMGLVSQLDHSAYLGRELAKAELSHATKSRYIQDKAQGHLDAGEGCRG